MVGLTSIIMEFCDNGDLFQKILQHHKDQTRFDEHGRRHQKSGACWSRA